MSAFRTIFFRPRLAVDWRIPVAALVRTSNGVRSVFAEVLPDSRCLGGAATHSVMRQGIAEVAERPHWNALPVSVGPHFELGQERVIPKSVDPEKWVKQWALPCHQSIYGTGESRGHHLATVAYNHLKSWNVSRYVKKSLRPGRIAEINRIPEGVSVITHYVEGTSSVLLMEPFLLRSESIRELVGNVFQKFSTYSSGWNAESGRHNENLVYVLPGTRDRDLADVADKLSPVARVVDTGDDSARREFVQYVQSVGEAFHRLPSPTAD